MKLLSQMTTDISIHALLAESDGCRIEHDAAVAYDFYPRSPCGERPHGRAAAGCGIHISIHALLAESDDAYLAALGKGVQISIHALLAESDPIMRKYCPSTKISIHALLAESDWCRYCCPSRTR